MNAAQRKLVSILDRHTPADDEEAQDAAEIRRLVLAAEHPFHRTTLPGHVTGSALVIHPAERMVLLHYHKSLGLWMQFGGHADDGEIDPAAIALRETIEESGLRDLAFFPPADSTRLIEVDIHVISPWGDMPQHLHLDFRYLLTTADSRPPPGRPGESNQFRWLPLEVLLNGGSGLKTDLGRLFARVEQVLDENL